MTHRDKLRAKLIQGSSLMLHDVRRLLDMMGYELARHRGSHEQWVRHGRTFTLATHGKDVPRYIMDALKKLAEEQDV